MLGEAGAEREVRRSAVIDCRGLQPQMHVKSQFSGDRRGSKGSMELCDEGVKQDGKNKGVARNGE